MEGFWAGVGKVVKAGFEVAAYAAKRGRFVRYLAFLQGETTEQGRLALLREYPPSKLGVWERNELLNHFTVFREEARKIVDAIPLEE